MCGANTTAIDDPTTRHSPHTYTLPINHTTTPSPRESNGPTQINLKGI